jgi:signal peptidase II
LSARAGATARTLAVAAAVVLADQVTKAVIRSELERGERIDVALGIDLTRVTNRGIAFGLLGDGGEGLVIAVTVGALALLLAWAIATPDAPWMWLAAGLLTGGALGNLIDRIRDDAVTDFLDPPLWPAFNLADVAITVGVAALALSVLRE